MKTSNAPYLQTRHFKGNDKPYFSTNEKLNRSTGFRERAEKCYLIDYKISKLLSLNIMFKTTAGLHYYVNCSKCDPLFAKQ